MSISELRDETCEVLTPAVRREVVARAIHDSCHGDPHVRAEARGWLLEAVELVEGVNLAGSEARGL